MYVYFREFLTGFHKRKLQRKKKAQEELQQQLKEERKRLKADAKESYKKLVVSHRPIPELEDLLQEEYEDDEVTVKVVELSADKLSARNTFIGPNLSTYAAKDEEEENADEEEESEKEELPGMELKRKKKIKEGVKQEEFKTQKDVKRLLKKKATKNVQKSKVFQLKNKIESRKQRKKSLQQKKQRQSFQNKKTKSRRGKPH